jgi:hypothetical protein
LFIIFKTASTAMGLSSLELADTTLEDKAVLTHSISWFLSVKSTGVEIVLRIFNDSSRATWKPSEIVVGWMPLSRRI